MPDRHKPLVNNGFLCVGLLLMTVGCSGEGACDEYQDLKCDCHQVLCDEEMAHDINKKDEEACERAIQSWDCDDAKAARDLTDSRDWETSDD